MRSNHPFVKKKRMQVAAETGCTIKQEKKRDDDYAVNHKTWLVKFTTRIWLYDTTASS